MKKESKDDKAEIKKVNGSCVISGQYIPIQDEKSLFTRSTMIALKQKKDNNDE